MSFFSFSLCAVHRYVPVAASLVLIGQAAWAQSLSPTVLKPEIFQVRSQTATVYSEPADSGPTAGRVSQGRMLRATGEHRDGFIGLATKSGQKLWIKESDVKTPAPVAEADLETVEEPARVNRHPKTDGHLDHALHFPPRLTFDLGASTGSYSNGASSLSYSELNVGLNAFFAHWLDWRNALFARFVSGGTNVFGLDSSVRGILTLGDGELGATLFAGPGWRFANTGDHVPFLEGGAVFNIRGVALGAGVRSFQRSWVGSSLSNDVQYFIILSGGGSL